MTVFVLDASVTLAWFLEDQASQATDDLLLEHVTRGAAAPTLWRWECVNVLLKTARALSLPKTAVDEELALFRVHLDRTEVDAGDEAAFDRAVRLAVAHRLSSYDAAYLELAIRRGLPLATLDRALRRAAEAEGVAVLPEPAEAV